MGTLKKTCAWRPKRTTNTFSQQGHSLTILKGSLQPGLCINGTFRKWNVQNAKWYKNKHMLHIIGGRGLSKKGFGSAVHKCAPMCMPPPPLSIGKSSAMSTWGRFFSHKMWRRLFQGKGCAQFWEQHSVLWGGEGSVTATLRQKQRMKSRGVTLAEPCKSMCSVLGPSL